MPPLLHKLDSRHSFNRSLLCLGLDPSLEDIEQYCKKENLAPIDDNNIFTLLVSYCQYLVNETKDYILCVKPNLAFFIQFGFHGINALKHVVEWIPKELAVILDCKFGDISNTMVHYAKFAFDYIKADAVTINLYMGVDVLKSSVTKTTADNAFNSVFVLASTTNLSADTIQSASVDNTELFLHIINECEQYSVAPTGATIGYVIGATKTNALAKARRLTNAWFLVPGVSAQGGSLIDAVRSGVRPDGKGIIISVSRGISKSDNPRQIAFSLYKEIEREVNSITN